MGKSTFLNAALELDLAIVSPTPQTTRDALLGVLHHGATELRLLDTPGLHAPKTELGRRMNQAARDAARGADVVLFMTDVPATARGAREPLRVHPGDRTLLADLARDGTPVVLAVNKVDRVKEKQRLLPLLEELAALRTFVAVVPFSARSTDGVDRVLDEVAALCPPGDFAYGDDDVTDRPMRFFAAEYVREQILRATEEEVPHATAVAIDEYIEPPGSGRVRVSATIHVERDGQKKILVGHGADMVKRIGTAARQRLEALIGRPVHLALWVRVTPDWRASPNLLAELGYGGGRA